MRHPGRESERARRRVDQALPVLRRTLAEYLTSLPRTRPDAFRDHDLLQLLKTFIDRFDELPLKRRSVLTLAHAARDARNEWAHDDGALSPERALHHLSAVCQLLEAIGAGPAFEEVDALYQEQLRILVARDDRASPEPPDEPRPSSRTAEAPPAAKPIPPSADVPPNRAGGKYAALQEHLATTSEDRWQVSFEELEALVGFRLPASARRYQAWWSNSTSHTQARSWLAAGWATREVDVGAERVSFVRTTAPSAASDVATAVPTASRVKANEAARSYLDSAFQADDIRAFAAEHLVAAARRAGQETVSIRAGDVGARLGLQRNMPNVCSALGGRKFEALAGVSLVERSGPRVGANTVFHFAINRGPSTGGADRPLRTAGARTTLRPPPGPATAPTASAGDALSAFPRRTALVFPCAAAKAPGAGYMREANGRRVYFVGDPGSAPADATVAYRRPDDLVADGRSFRDALEVYNRRPGDNPWGLLPAWQLYRHPVFRRLAVAAGTENLFILSAGWGLIRADYLTPAYDITFSVNADRYKRRKGRDLYEDFRQLDADAYDRIVFTGGNDYRPFFLSLTEGMRAERVVYHNSSAAFDVPNARLVRFETRTKTNWHYEWAERLLDGTLTLPA